MNLKNINGQKLREIIDWIESNQQMQKYIRGPDVLQRNLCQMDDQITFSNILGGGRKQVTKWTQPTAG